MSAAIRSTLPDQHRVSVPGTRPPTPPIPTSVWSAHDDQHHRLCMHDLDPTTCSVCKYRGMPPVYLFGRNGPYHSDAECAALLAEREAATKRGAEMAPAVVARPGSVALDGRSACTVCA